MDTRMFIFGVRIKFWLYTFLILQQKPVLNFVLITPSKFNLSKFKHSVYLIVYFMKINVNII